MQMQLFDANGNKILFQELNQRDSSISIQNLLPGVHIIRLRIATEYSLHKGVKNFVTHFTGCFQIRFTLLTSD
ncbi:MAG: T9SS type A sorting domain-containing protein [Saprospiraceae bacterium]|nr:T9SS type A sorting domain-containing protein [Saprospiraceae bacterium]